MVFPSLAKSRTSWRVMVNQKILDSYHPGKILRLGLDYVPLRLIASFVKSIQLPEIADIC